MKKSKDTRYDFYRYQGTCEIMHRVAVIGLGSCGMEALKALLEMGIDPVDLVAVDAFDPHRFMSTRVFHDRTPGIEVAFPEETTGRCGIVVIPETGSMIINPITDDLSYAPVGACDIAIIALDYSSDPKAETGKGWHLLNATEETITLVRLGVPTIFVTNSEQLPAVIKKVEAILPVAN